MSWIIRRIFDGKYGSPKYLAAQAWPGTYTSNIKNARQFETQQMAEKECKFYERVSFREQMSSPHCE